MLGMRRTMFVVPDELAPVVQAACTRAIAAQDAAPLPAAPRRALASPSDVAALVGRASRTRPLRPSSSAAKPPPRSWARTCPSCKRRSVWPRARATPARRASPRGCSCSCLPKGKIVRGRPRGSWISSQYRWAPIDAWLPGGLPAARHAVAQVALIGAWLRAFGPGHARRPEVVDRPDAGRGEARAVQALERGRGRPGRGDGLSCWPTTLEPSSPTRAVGGAAARARRDADGATSSATGSSGRTRRRCSTVRAISGRRSGATGASSAAGPSARTARSPSSCSKTLARDGRASASTPPPTRWRLAGRACG